MNYKAVIAYDGTDFCGWQRQPESPTVQGEMEKALARLCGRAVTVSGAGRTDAGVHARGQTASFRAELRLDDEELLRALNALLPDSVRIIAVRRARADFHARKSAVSKIYRYRIRNARQVSPFDVRYVLHWPGRLDADSMSQAARSFRPRGRFLGVLLEPSPPPRAPGDALRDPAARPRDRLHDRSQRLPKIYGADDCRHAP